jgi:alpha-1,3-rhamnosyl/mannosyltransferase
MEGDGMRVLFNRSSTLGVLTGVGHHTAQLLRCLRRPADDVHIDVYPTGGIWWLRSLGARVFRELPGSADAAEAKPKEAPAASLPRRVLQTMRGWGRNVVERRQRSIFFGQPYDLYHEPNFIPQPSDIPTLTSVHDLSALLHPEWHPAERVAKFAREFPQALSRSVHFLAVSEFTRQELIRACGVPAERVTRVHNGVRTECRPLPVGVVARRLRRLGLPAQYLLCVGTIEPRKNVLRLLQAYCALPAALRERCPLLLAGPWGWSAADIAEYFHARAAACGVRHLGYLTDADLTVLYNGARALVYPSWYEGFGLPVAEMLACGGAVIASTADALREVAGDCAEYVTPEDTDGWRAALARAITDDDWREQLRQRTMAQGRKFTWERSAAETLQLYRRLAGGATDALAA